MYNVYVDGGGNSKDNCVMGMVIWDDNEKIVFKYASNLYTSSTSNEAEYDALYHTLHIINLNFRLGYLKDEDITIYMDSELVVFQMLGHYDVNAPNLIERHRRTVQSLKHLRHDMKSKIVLKHTHRENNKIADQLGRELREQNG